MTRLQLLGPVGLQDSSGREIRSVLQQPKRLALLVYLVLASRSGFCRRDSLTALFWPELDQEHARNALRQAVHFLRAALGAGVIVSRGDEDVGVAEGALTCDVLAFRAALAGDRLADALEIYRTDLLPGFFVSDTPEFEDWLELERAALRESAVGAAWRLAESSKGDRGVALHWARRAAALTPGDEPATQRLLRFLVDQGDRAGALRAYEAFQRRLHSEFGLSPSAETVRMVREIRSASPAEPHAESAVAAGVAASPAAGSRPTSRDSGDVAPTGTGAPLMHRRRPGPVVGVAVVLVAVALVTAVTIRACADRPLSSTDQDLVAVAPFEAPDSRYELWREGLMSVLTANLDGAGPLRTVPTALVLRRWQGPFDREAAGRLGRATGAGIAVTGRVDGAGTDSVRILAILVDAKNRQTLAQIEVRGPEARFDRLTDSLTVALLRELGRTRPIGAVRSATIGSRSLPALKAFLRGDQLYRRTQWDSALGFYRQAVELDSTFALALRRIGNVLGWQGLAGGEVAREFHARAGRFNHGLSPHDSLLVLADSLASALYGFDSDPAWWTHVRRLRTTMLDAARRYPEDPEVWSATGEAWFHFQVGVGIPLAEVLNTFDRAILLDSSFAPAYLHPVDLAVRLGDPARALRYARSYLGRGPGDVTARGIALFERVVRQGGLSPADSTEYATTAQPAELFEAWAALNSYADSAESAVRLARWMAARRWTTPAPFRDPAFAATLLARSLALRGHLAEAYRVAGSSDPAFFGELAWLGAVPEAEVRERFRRWLAGDDPAVGQFALPWLAGQGDTAAIAGFIRSRDPIAARPADPDRAGFDVAVARAWLAVARADTAGALELFLAVPDSLCPRCALHRLPTAELLLRANRLDEARTLLARELTGIHDGPRPLDVPWRLARAEATERAGDAEAAAAIYRSVLALWRNPDAGLRRSLDRARDGLARIHERAGNRHPE